eukprot:1157429-Pelagomonas_calceolata.AAC.4
MKGAELMQGWLSEHGNMSVDTCGVYPDSEGVLIVVLIKRVSDSRLAMSRLCLCCKVAGGGCAMVTTSRVRECEEFESHRWSVQAGSESARDARASHHESYRWSVKAGLEW